MIARRRRTARVSGGDWPSAFALFGYAAGFSFAYASLTAATGALLLFGAVQATMIGSGLWSRERLVKLQAIGFLLAVAGLVSFLLPGFSAPSIPGTLLMLGAGVAWGIYSLRGRRASSPINVTAGNFLRAVPLALALSLITLSRASIDGAGFWFAIASGTLTSGIGYAIWYAALPALQAVQAASVQLSVPVIAAVGGVIFLGESVSLRLGLASVAILGGIALVIVKKPS
jgi:drug/metabolite transporter (DMT)-like permease